MNENLTPEQQTFLLNILSNAVAKETGTAQELANEARDRITDGINKLLPSWKLVWGPAVYQHKHSGIPDHVMFAAARGAEGTEPAEIVVSIAGSTGSKLSYNWLTNNFNVLTRKTWRAHGSKKGKLAQGTWIGLKNLRKLKPFAKFPGAGQPIRNFLRSEARSAPRKITVTGFSLGGALAPTLALWLQDSKESWDPESQAEVHCRPAAGAATFNESLAHYYNNTFGDRAKRLSNELDVVPHAWNTSDLEKLPEIYGEYVRSKTIKRFANAARFFVQKKHYTHNEPSRHFNLGIIDPISGLNFDSLTELLPSSLFEGASDLDEDEKKNLAKFMHQANLQHVVAYLRYMKVEDIVPEPTLEALEAATGTSHEDIPERVVELFASIRKFEAAERAEGSPDS